MKRIFIALSLLCVPLLAFSENKIKMVTYFPVPYVAYSKINASKQLDIGLTSACEMNLGCSESGALGIRPLQATTVNLNRGKLDLNTASAVKSTNVALGSGSGEANIDFSANLRIGTLNNGYSLEAADMTEDELKLFASHMRTGGEKFPSCAATGASGAPQVSWQKVKLKKAEEVYLVCGSPQESVCNPPSGEATSQSCPSGYTGTQTRTWNYSTYSWNAWQGTCTPNSKKFIWVETGRLNKQPNLNNKYTSNYDGDLSGCQTHCYETVGPGDECMGYINFEGRSCTTEGETKSCESWGELLSDGSCDCFWQRITWTCREA
ncbi:hypothetical protein [Candidatus Avelusimicrobium alvi]|uniref:hypothetical protein n=1 Tax=Candidatus Avelusimicrobium alvi TaxID=3416221 RepID=UPI003D0E606C